MGRRKLFGVCLKRCLCSGALLKAIVIVSLLQLGISALLLAVTSPTAERKTASSLPPSLPFLHIKKCVESCIPTAELFSSQMNTLTDFSLTFCIHKCLITGILSQNFKITCFSVSQFIVKIFAIIFSRWHKIQRFGIFFSVWTLITGLNLKKVANNFWEKKEKVLQWNEWNGRCIDWLDRSSSVLWIQYCHGLKKYCLKCFRKGKET